MERLYFGAARFELTDLENYGRLREIALKAFGYSRDNLASDELIELREVTFQGNADDLKVLASFLNEMAKELENGPKEFGHRHLQDELEGWSSQWPDVIVARQAP